MRQERWSYKDFDAFGRWYSVSRHRKTGRPAAATTLRTKQVHVAAVANMIGAPDEVFLGTSLGSRSEIVFLLDRLATKMTPGAMRQAVYALRSYGDYAVAQGWVKQHEVRTGDVPPRNPQPAIVCYSVEEMETFIASARGKGLRWWAFLCFMADTGRRVDEVLRLRWDWFRLDSTPPYIELPETKNGKPQYVPLPSRLYLQVFTPENIERLKAERRTGNRRWNRDPEEHPFPWAYTTVYNIFARFCVQAGLPNRGFHNFRHSVITHRLAAGMPLQAVSALAGHSSTAITDRRYNHTDALSFAHLLN